VTVVEVLRFGDEKALVFEAGYWKRALLLLKRAESGSGWALKTPQKN
jgi:hypothetical protein